MSEDSQPETQLRRRRSAEAGGGARGGPGGSAALNLELGFRVSDGGPPRGTPSPCSVQFPPGVPDQQRPTSSAVAEFRKKQQSFEIQIEDCEEEEIVCDSDNEGEDLSINRPATPMFPLQQDFGANVNYKEGPQNNEFLQVKVVDHDCLTDVSDADDDAE